MGGTKVETARVLLRPFQPEDVDAAHVWFGDAEVMRYTPTGPDPSREHTRERLAEYGRHQSQHGFSKWAISLPSGTLIGDAGLLHMHETGEIELGFRLSRAHWGKGYATEVASAWLIAARDELALPRVVAFAHPDNAASHRVLEKVGFCFCRRGVVMQMPALIYEMSLVVHP